MKPIDFCHIAPTKYLYLTQQNGAHLLLAHLVESDPAYCRYYANLKDGLYKIMDNSAFEMFKQGRPMYDSSKLIDLAKQCNADCIVMSDYPKEPWTKTVKQAMLSIDEIKDSGFDTFFVPQSELGDMNGLITSIEWALNEPRIDIIGLSILACPIASGLDESGSLRNETYRLQRYLSRWNVLQRLEASGKLDIRAIKKFHCLGMTEGPREIELLSRYSKYIRSWDSSAAIWAGMHDIAFDNSPTGLRSGKFEKEVDFQHQKCDSMNTVNHNIGYINKLIERWS